MQPTANSFPLTESMKKFIVFDFDGTLVDSKEIFISVFNQLAAKHKFGRIEHENIEHLRNLSMSERFRTLRIPVYKIPVMSIEFLKLYGNSAASLCLFDGMGEVLHQLKEQGYTVAIISSNSNATIKTFLKSNGLDHITNIHCSIKLFGKDSVIRRFMKKYGLHKSEMLYVGDELRDIVACKKNNVKIVWVKWGFENEASALTSDPDFIANKPADIIEIVNENFALQVI